MAIDSRHPQYTDRLADWVTMTDTYKGEREVKEKTTLYLPPTSGMVFDGLQPGQPGATAYDAYLRRAVFPDVVQSAVSAMVGVMHNKPPVIELPAALEPLRDAATNQGESLEQLLRNINEEQLVTGRLGLLVDVPNDAPVGVLPYLAMYRGVSVLNWDDGTRTTPKLQNLNLVTLDESEFVRTDNFDWEYQNKFRVMIIGDPLENEPAGTGVYRTGVFDVDSASFNPNDTVSPSLGGRTLDFIPFTFINARDIVPSPDAPPLLGLAHLALTVYRGEADYRQSLFMQGQDTLVVSGATEEDFRVGANATIVLPVGGDAKFIGVASEGLSEQRVALENDRRVAAQMGGNLMDATSRQKESGDALRIRVAASTATLNHIALAGSFGLEQALKHAAIWYGANPEEVSVRPNMDFADDELEGRTLVDYMTARSLGAPLSRRSIHTLMQRKDLTDLSYEEELEELSSEEDGAGMPEASETSEPVEE